ncbi:unnamed protein product, partial [Ectocarpus sp. 8 AP-2014]
MSHNKLLRPTRIIPGASLTKTGLTCPGDSLRKRGRAVPGGKGSLTHSSKRLQEKTGTRTPAQGSSATASSASASASSSPSRQTPKKQSLCLDAFVVVLNHQSCDEGLKRWYTSIRELQLVSLEFCGVCRSTSILRVRVDHKAPPSLWSPTKSFSYALPDAWNRVPAVRAYGWTWSIP